MHRSRPISLAALLAGIILILAACGAGTTSSAAPSAAPPATDDGGGGTAGETVSLDDDEFSPSSLTIPVGTTVTFTDGEDHTVTEGSNGTAVADPIVDEQWSGEPIIVSFDEAGTFNITCKIHPEMNMTITVEG